MAYDRLGRPTRLQHGEQTPIEIDYNRRGQPEAISRGQRTITYAYTPTGELQSITDPDGETITLTYDEAGRAVALHGSDGQHIDIAQDTENRTLQSQIAENGLLATVGYLYDAENRLAAKTTANGDILERYRYDSDGDLVGVEDAEGNQQQLSYGNPTGLLSAGTLSRIGLIQPPPGDADSARLSGYTDQRGNETLYIQDDFGRLVAVISPDQGLHSYEYDRAGNIIAETNAEGDTTTYAYDAANRVVQWEDSDGATTIGYHQGNGKPAEIAGPHSTETFAYNAEGQLSQHNRHLDGHVFTTSLCLRPARQPQRRVPAGWPGAGLPLPRRWRTERPTPRAHKKRLLRPDDDCG